MRKGILTHLKLVHSLIFLEKSRIFASSVSKTEWAEIFQPQEISSFPLHYFQSLTYNSEILNLEDPPSIAFCFLGSSIIHSPLWFFFILITNSFVVGHKISASSVTNSSLILPGFGKEHTATKSDVTLYLKLSSYFYKFLLMKENQTNWIQKTILKFENI